jgi:hypothetical protein
VVPSGGKGERDGEFREPGEHVIGVPTGGRDWLVSGVSLIGWHRMEGGCGRRTCWEG